MVDFVGAVHAQLEGARGSFNPLVQLALKINERLHRTRESRKLRWKKLYTGQVVLHTVLSTCFLHQTVKASLDLEINKYKEQVAAIEHSCGLHLSSTSKLAH